MDAVLEWGVEAVLWFQGFSPALDLPFKAFTSLGEEGFFMLLLPLVYWCVDRRAGSRLAVLFLISAWANATVKALGGQPRPCTYDGRVQNLVGGQLEAEDFGFPSGHTQATVVVWSYLAARLRRRWAWVVAGVLMVCVPLSRVYLGMHFPQDLLGGYVLGAVLLAGFLRLGPQAAGWLAARGVGWQLAAAVAAPLLLMALYPTQGGGRACGALLGMGVGIVLERRWVGFEAGGRWQARAARLLLGVALVFGLHVGLGAGLEGVGPALAVRFVRYAVVGLTVMVGAPWLFVRLRLAPRAT